MAISDWMDVVNQLFGPSENANALTMSQVALRAVLIYLAGYAIVRIGDNRFVGRNTPFDIVLGFIFGSTLSRAINSSAPPFDTIVAAVILVFLHWVFVSLSFYSKTANRVLNGRPVALIKEGIPQKENLCRKKVSGPLLEETLRLDAKLDDLGQVSDAYLERSGTISILPRRGQPKVVEVKVEEGVQTIKIEIR